MKPLNAGRFGVWFGADRLSAKQCAELVAFVERLGFGTLWYSKSRVYEPMALGSYLLSCSSRLKIGSSIATNYARGALATAGAMPMRNADALQSVLPC